MTWITCFHLSWLIHIRIIGNIWLCSILFSVSFELAAYALCSDTDLVEKMATQWICTVVNYKQIFHWILLAINTKGVARCRFYIGTTSRWYFSGALATNIISNWKHCAKFCYLFSATSNSECLVKRLSGATLLASNCKVYSFNRIGIIYDVLLVYFFVAMRWVSVLLFSIHTAYIPKCVQRTTDSFLFIFIFMNAMTISIEYPFNDCITW